MSDKHTSTRHSLTVKCCSKNCKGAASNTSWKWRINSGSKWKCICITI